MSLIHKEINRLYEVFLGYFESLKQMEQLVKTGGNIGTVEDELIRIIQNGYQVAAILTDIITTPLFKPKFDKDGKVALTADNVVEIETDKDGMQILNGDAIEQVLSKANSDSTSY